MRVVRGQANRLSRIGLSVVLGILLAAILAASLNAPGTPTTAAKPLAATPGNPVPATRGSLLPIQEPACATAPTGMISWWPGEGNADDIQDGNNGTLVGAIFSSGKVGQAFSLDGIDDWVEVPDADNLDLTSQITIDAWINPTVLGGRIVDKITSGESDGYALDIFGGKVRFVFDGQEVSGSTTLPTGTFTHVTGTYDFSTLSVYVNGVLDGTLSAEELALPPNNLPLRIGADQSGANVFSGLIDEVEIFNRALAEGEILSIVSADSAGKCKSECILTCPEEITQPNDLNQCGAVVNFAPTSSACGTVTCAPPSDSFFPKGSTSVTCTAAGGSMCSFTITVNDTDPPIMICSGIGASTDPNQCTAVVDYPPDIATDNCPGVTLVCTPPSHSTFDKGTTTVSCTATDASSNTNTCDFDVTVEDLQPPSITCPSNITQPNESEQCGAVVTYPPPTVSDNCAEAGAPNCSPASGSFFAVGTTTVTCTVADSSGNTATCTFTVTVNNTEPVTITCPANITQANDSNQCGAVVTYPAPTESGNCAQTPTCSPASGSFFPKGTTTVTCNAATAGPGCTFTVTVNDIEPPTITCPPNQTRPNDPNQCGAAVTYPPPTVSDNCAAVEAMCSPASGSFFPKGSTTVTCTASDASSNSPDAICTFTVTVNDTQPPTITCPPNITTMPAPDNPCVPATFSASAIDNCQGVTVDCTPASGSCFPVGSTTVSCTATDMSGNIATCSFSVIVFDICLQDDSNPSIVFLANSDTGDYSFCCEGTVFIGVALVTRRGNIATFQHNAPDHRVQAMYDGAVFKGSASLQAPPGTIRCTITDRDTRNNSCVCQ